MFTAFGRQHSSAPDGRSGGIDMEQEDGNRGSQGGEVNISLQDLKVGGPAVKDNAHVLHNGACSATFLCHYCVLWLLKKHHHCLSTPK